jgi:DNA gyrase/topoisomerase IV subunit B
LYINGVETRVFEESEYAFSQGLIGIGISAFNTLPVEIEINSVTISEP